VIEQLSGLTTPEYVIIRNTGSLAQDLTGWTLFSVIGSQSYSFPAGYVLAAGASVEVQSYTGAVDAPPNILLWGGVAIWNNTGDKAELLRPDSSVVSSVCYLAGCP